MNCPNCGSDKYREEKSEIYKVAPNSRRCLDCDTLWINYEKPLTDEEIEFHLMYGFYYGVDE